MRDFTIVKVEAVEVSALHQVTQGLRLKGSEARITDLPEMEQQTATLDPLTHVKHLQVEVCGLK